MENPSMALLSSSSSPKPAFSQCFSTNPLRPRRLSSSLTLLFARPSPRTSKRVSFSVRALKGDVGAGVFSSLSSGKGQQTISSVGSPNLAVPLPPSSSSVGSPLFWIGVGVGVGFPAIFSFVAARLKALKGNQNAAAYKEVEVDSQAGQPIGERNPSLTVEAVVKILEDPVMQKMCYPDLPLKMRNPASFKRMLQNPQTRKQIEDILDGISGNPEWDNWKMDTLQNFDFNSPEVKDEFDQLGFTPEECFYFNKVMANPDIAMALQNPKIEAFIIDCSQNPLSLLKYLFNEEVLSLLKLLYDHDQELRMSSSKYQNSSQK